MGDVRLGVLGGLIIGELQVCRWIGASRSCVREIKLVMCEARRSRERRSYYSFARQTTEKDMETPSKNEEKTTKKTVIKN
jgi:hypothetical protein